MSTRFNPEPDQSLFDGDGVSCSFGESKGWYEHIQACPDDEELFLFFDSEGNFRFRAATDHLIEALRDAITTIGRDYRLHIEGSHAVEVVLDAIATVGRDYHLNVGRDHALAVGQDSELAAGRDISFRAGRDCIVNAEQVRANAEVLVEDTDDGNTTWMEIHDGKTYFNLGRFVRWLSSQNLDARVRALEGL